LIEQGGDITIRQVTSVDKKLEVRERIKRRYAFKNYPDEFSFRCKCIVVFQNLDGVDVILFGLYVYEHDHTNPLPNKRTVYISYLDSVHFMRPRHWRTFIYHEILISYLDYVRKRGFSSAHIWACPPLKGDDYILYAKPEDQKTPKDDRLRQWYIDMLIECQRRGVVGKLTNMYDLYFSNEKNDATVVPYMDGDYFPAEVENIIKDIEEGKSSKKNNTQGQTKKKNNPKTKTKKKSGRGGTRSTGLDEDALRASGIIPPGKDQKSLEEGGRDYVMVKLGETIQPMKESFIVAFLAWDGAREEDMVVPKEIEEYRNTHGVVVNWTPKAKDDSDDADKANDKESASDAKEAENSNTEGAPTISTPDETGISESADKDVGETSADGNKEPGDDKIKAEPSTDASPPVDENKDAAKKQGVTTVSMEERKGKFAAMARKRGLDDTGDDTSVKCEPAPITVKDSKGRMVKVLDDDAEEMDCEFLNNRQAFLNLCQGNHYQFDQVRRAKHSSMMVLWHLHNRDAPKFVQQCATCSREILTGFRFHCPTCADFDQCQECEQNPKIMKHQHPLKPIPVATGQQSDLTESQRKERQRSIQLHMHLLQHAATCQSPKCPSANCTKMKGLLKHGGQCQIKATGGCNVCKRIWALLQIHARQCKADSCPVPNCMAIRERVRQLKQQQQAMDDRRRQEMNRAYGGAR
jgi:E1A/CREB-binding protein